ncbi:D-alanine--poly(phosphoribitol) ligase subunit DltC [Floricoccus penangensis]|uniref:D-alanyl carrier protein n=1 Tax=Floricoccus penangensis TaxID=1859475 RepID=A0A9Q5P0P6_9LACT|nr:D-alanine--poly(phosphoribitol) ligase subunit DltC [Floricoccus penangensis]OFI48000.1 D-alanine--poly(phosphoribitol) ligase subunit 2 [Floricoccus penangensis]URZ87529.1 D-alanine--poly(phosphoribitol) ligase subunit DltC [Floricoccus penangensis]
MENVKNGIIDIMEEVSGEDVTSMMDENFYDNGLLDSMATIEVLMSIQDEFGVTIPVLGFVREEWDTPNKVIAKVTEMLG